MREQERIDRVIEPWTKKERNTAASFSNRIGGAFRRESLEYPVLTSTFPGFILMAACCTTPVFLILHPGSFL